MLESNREDVKLEAMRCITVMTAKGRLSVPRTLFPHIVKNVSSKNPELKKLIYLYLTNFADQEPDLALLPVATLQKSIKNPNPLVRSSALKVLTSMRLNILTAIFMATLKNSVNDLSPYVRKTVAHSIIKIYRLDPSLKPELVEYIERLLNDKNSMVLSSVVAAFDVVCPERLDLVKKHYRRFCFILADCNEWGQILMLKLLARCIQDGTTEDPKILLRSAKPLVHSNNSAVVMAVIKIFISLANHNEVRSTITRPLLRMLVSHREIELVVLNMIENLTTLSNPNLTSLAPDDESLHGVPSPDHETGAPDAANGVDAEAKVESECNNEARVVVEENDNDDEKLENEDKNSDNEVKQSENEVKKSEDEESEEEEEEEDEDGSNDEEEDEEEDDDTEESDSDEEEDEDESEEVSLHNNVDASPAGATHDGSESGKEDDVKRDSVQDPRAFREVFRPYIKSFFVKHTDCTLIRLVKLKILTNLSSSVNVTQILRELQAYIAIYVDDVEFVSASIHAIGRCAVIVKEVAHTCLNGLTKLLSNNNEHIVSEAIVVLRSQIINKKIKTMGPIGQGQANEGSEEQRPAEEQNQNELDHSQVDEDEIMVSAVIKQVTKLLPTVTAPQARATILWILAEFCDKNLTAAKCAPNVLRLIAKSFCQEDNFVKLQCLTLASKFLLSLDKDKKADLYNKIKLLAGYLFSLAKYDINHDVRDRGRFLKKLLEDEDLCAKVLNGVGHQAEPSLAA